MALVDTKDAFLQGCVFYKQGKFLDALKNFDSILENNPNHFDTLAMRAITLTKLGKYKEALEAVDVALEMEPKNWENLRLAIA